MHQICSDSPTHSVCKVEHTTYAERLAEGIVNSTAVHKTQRSIEQMKKDHITSLLWGLMMLPYRENQLWMSHQRTIRRGREFPCFMTLFLERFLFAPNRAHAIVFLLRTWSKNKQKEKKKFKE